MTTSAKQYVALLRAINVGGRSIIKMADLRALFESLGLTGVATYIQTGNVIFTTTETDRELLARKIEGKLEAVLGRPATVFVLSPAELERAVDNNPFEPERFEAERRCHLMFLSGEPDSARRAALMAQQADVYRFHVHGRVLYYSYSRQADRSRRSIDFEKLLGVAGTARTWKVVAKLVELTTV